MVHVQKRADVTASLRSKSIVMHTFLSALDR